MVYGIRELEVDAANVFGHCRVLDGQRDRTWFVLCPTSALDILPHFVPFVFDGDELDGFGADIQSGRHVVHAEFLASVGWSPPSQQLC